mmetsp:Transcript_26465/g.61466  ORF Transcript_26465/g.61466 Transcript_26465/m.61466 type:complete len:377 (+) Transcript_26465:868-1998(+)
MRRAYSQYVVNRENDDADQLYVKERLGRARPAVFHRHLGVASFGHIAQLRHGLQKHRCRSNEDHHCDKVRSPRCDYTGRRVVEDFENRPCYRPWQGLAVRARQLVEHAHLLAPNHHESLLRNLQELWRILPFPLKVPRIRGLEVRAKHTDRQSEENDSCVETQHADCSANVRSRGHVSIAHCCCGCEHPPQRDRDGSERREDVVTVGVLSDEYASGMAALDKLRVHRKVGAFEVEDHRGEDDSKDHVEEHEDGQRHTAFKHCLNAESDAGMVLRKLQQSQNAHEAEDAYGAHRVISEDGSQVERNNRGQINQIQRGGSIAANTNQACGAIFRLSARCRDPHQVFDGKDGYAHCLNGRKPGKRHRFASLCSQGLSSS